MWDVSFGVRQQKLGESEGNTYSNGQSEWLSAYIFVDTEELPAEKELETLQRTDLREFKYMINLL